MTIDCWERRRDLFDIFTSEFVHEEAERDNKDAAQKRLKSLEEIPILELTDSAI